MIAYIYFYRVANKGNRHDGKEEAAVAVAVPTTPPMTNAILVVVSDIIIIYTSLSMRLICCSSIFDSNVKPSPSIDQRTGRNQYNQLFPNTFLYNKTQYTFQYGTISTHFQFFFQPKSYFLTILALLGSLISCISIVVLPFKTNMV